MKYTEIVSFLDNLAADMNTTCMLSKEEVKKISTSMKSAYYSLTQVKVNENLSHSAIAAINSTIETDF